MRFVVLVLVVLCGVDASAAPVRLRVGTQAIDGSRYMQDILALGKEIEARTEGAVQLDVVANGRLGDDAAMAELIRQGKLDGGGLSETGLVALAPEMAAWKYPGLFRSYDEVDRATAALDRDVVELFADKQLVFVMWADLGFAHLFATEPVASLRDLVRAATPWLASPIDGKLTEAIASGKARAWALPPLYTVAMGSTGAAGARVMSDLRYRYVVGGLVFSAAAWTRLAPQQQQQVRDACRAFEPRIRASWRRETENGIAALRRAGVQIRATTDAEATAFADASAKLRDGALVTKIAAAAH